MIQITLSTISEETRQETVARLILCYLYKRSADNFKKDCASFTYVSSYNYGATASQHVVVVSFDDMYYAFDIVLIADPYDCDIVVGLFQNIAICFGRNKIFLPEKNIILDSTRTLPWVEDAQEYMSMKN